MKQLIQILLLTILFTTIVACDRKVKFSQLKDGKDGTSCTVINRSPVGATILCTDGSSADINNGTNGQDGVNGSNGILRVVDPCGPSTAPDEILIVLSDFTVIAWYQSVGLSVLTPHVVYQTTDSQACRFKVDEFGNVILQ